jgi:hypothetical protein
MANSQNGWPASSSKGAIGIIDAKVPGTNVNFPQGVKGGDVATVLMYVAEQFHKTVEPLRDGWCWGFHYKQIEGSTTLSNHASGTAIDLNAPEHPMGKSNTFDSKQVSAIRKILSYCGGVVRWGGDYKQRPDEMHFEINDDAAAVKKLADKIRNDKKIPKPPTLLEVDGKLGEKTITRWQQIMKTKVDGKISEPSQLVRAVQERLKDTVDRSLNVDGYGIKQDGQRYKTVGALQRYLKSPVDERMSEPVSEVVKALQRRLNTGKF